MAYLDTPTSVVTDTTSHQLATTSLIARGLYGKLGNNSVQVLSYKDSMIRVRVVEPGIYPSDWQVMPWMEASLVTYTSDYQGFYPLSKSQIHHYSDHPATTRNGLCTQCTVEAIDAIVEQF